MLTKMLIDAAHSEETRVAVVDGARVEDFDYETVTKTQISGNIYLARVTRVEPSLQAAFVEYGGGRHGFLAFSEIHPDYYQIPAADREALLEAERAAQFQHLIQGRSGVYHPASKEPRDMKDKRPARGSASPGSRTSFPRSWCLSSASRT